MIVGNVQYIGKSLFHDVALPDRIVKVKRNDWLVVELNKCRELVDTGNFMPDEDTQKLFEQFSGIHDKKIIDGMLTGKRCFLIGSGSSLKGFDFSRLDKEFTIAINHTILYYPKAFSNIFLDGIFLDKNNNEARVVLKNYKGMIFCSFRTQYQKENLNAIPFYVNNDKVQKKFNKGLWGARLTGLAAISLAIIMNAEKIYLLGYDMNKHATNLHFYDENGKAKYNNDKGYRGERISSNILAFKQFIDYKDKIINLNPKSEIPYFSRMTIDEVLNETPSK